MVRFSCFSTPALSQRPKKDQRFHSDLPSTSQQNDKDGPSSIMKQVVVEHDVSNSFSQGDTWKLEHLNSSSHDEFIKEDVHKTSIKRSQSLGCVLGNNQSSDLSCLNEDDEEIIDRHSNPFKRYAAESSSMGNEYAKPYDAISDNDSHEPLFSIEFLNKSDAQSNEFAPNSECLSSDNYPAAFARSQSISNFRADSDGFVDGDETHDLKHRSRSFQNLHSLHDDGYDSGDNWRGRHTINNKSRMGRYSSNDNTASDDEERWNQHADDHERMKNIEKGRDVDEDKYSHIEAWISQINVEDERAVHETSESSFSFPRQETEVEVSATPNIRPAGVKNKLGTEVAYNYISSLNASSTSAQIVNLGLVSVPFLGPFNSLRVLNLSGNNIAKVTSGCLPRGLHMLNLSKNSVSVIEGLRDLTRLRVLDLSYNRIVRIGRGLVNCSSIKELYLAGNKISDIEGLHRLRKLTTLDIAKNKISTAKGLGQLASNYASLQAINVEGNPAQKTVGDEQLKRYLISLLPNLIHYNKHAIKAGASSKDISDRSSTRSAARNDNNSRIPRRGSHTPGRIINRNILRLPLNGGGSKPAAKYVTEVEKKPKVEGVLRANGEFDRWEEMVMRGLGGSMAAVLSHPP